MRLEMRKNRSVKYFLYILSVIVLLSFIKTDVKASNLNRRDSIKSSGNINFESGEVYVTADDFIYLADEIDHLERTYKCNLVDALNLIGTYFRIDGTITQDSGQNEVNNEDLKTNLSFGDIKRGILESQSLLEVRDVQATNAAGEPIYYISEEARDNGENLQITTNDTGFPLYHTEVGANNITAGYAAWINGVLVKGNGEDNRISYDNGYKEGYTKGVADSLGKAHIVYSYHQHVGNSGQAGGCYGNLTGTSVIQCGCNSYAYDKDENGHTRCGNCGHNHGGSRCSYPKGYESYTYIGLVCGKTEATIESATIVY